MNAVIRYSDGLVAMVGDASELGRFTPEARRAMARFDTASFTTLEVELRLYTTGASVIARAFMTLGATAARMVSKRKSRMFFPKTFEEGVALARASADSALPSRDG